MQSKNRFVRLDETGRRPLHLKIDGQPVQALEGDTLMVAVLSNGRSLRQSEFTPGHRAGFCLMGACQDCLVWTEEGERLRSCTTPAKDGMSILTQPPEGQWTPI
jgi:NADH dehydrogenase/NADH:ubiquinone oxidoreductase subunit G